MSNNRPTLPNEIIAYTLTDLLPQHVVSRFSLLSKEFQQGSHSIWKTSIIKKFSISPNLLDKLDALKAEGKIIFDYKKVYTGLCQLHQNTQFIPPHLQCFLISPNLSHQALILACCANNESMLKLISHEYKLFYLELNFYANSCDVINTFFSHPSRLNETLTNEEYKELLAKMPFIRFNVIRIGHLEMTKLLFIIFENFKLIPIKRTIQSTCISNINRKAIELVEDSSLKELTISWTQALRDEYFASNSKCYDSYADYCQLILNTANTGSIEKFTLALNQENMQEELSLQEKLLNAQRILKDRNQDLLAAAAKATNAPLLEWLLTFTDIHGQLLFQPNITTLEAAVRQGNTHLTEKLLAIKDTNEKPLLTPNPEIISEAITTRKPNKIIEMLIYAPNLSNDTFTSLFLMCFQCMNTDHIQMLIHRQPINEQFLAIVKTRFPILPVFLNTLFLSESFFTQALESNSQELVINYLQQSYSLSPSHFFYRVRQVLKHPDSFISYMNQKGHHNASDLYLNIKDNLITFFESIQKKLEHNPVSFCEMEEINSTRQLIETLQFSGIKPKI